MKSLSDGVVRQGLLEGRVQRGRVVRVLLVPRGRLADRPVRRDRLE